MEFVKYHIAGTDYLVTDDASADLIVRTVCARRTGIGGAGVVVCADNPFGARFYRSDGREIPFDASGFFCAASFLSEKCGTNKISIVTDGGVKECGYISNNTMCLRMPIPKLNENDIRIRTADVGSHIDYVKIFFGTSRAVCITDDIYESILFGVGEKMSKYSSFKNGADVDFVKVVQKNTVEVRSYERGAGYNVSVNGVVAAVIALSKLGILEKNVEVSLDCGKMSVVLSDYISVCASVSKIAKCSLL